MGISKLQDICVSLELAKALEKAGYPQESFLFYSKTKYLGKNNGWDWELKIAIDSAYNGFADVSQPTEIVNDSSGQLSAPTVAELLENLPDKIRLGNKRYQEYKLNMYKKTVYNIAFYTNEISAAETKMVDSLAKMWLYLKKEGLLK